MSKQKTEKMFSKSIHLDNRLWFMKLHNNPLAHQNTPADYILSDSKHFILVECKQVTCKEGKGRLAFNRLKQMHDLLSFENKFPMFHKSYFCITFYDNRWDNSDIYIIPVKEMNFFVHNHSKVSANRQDMQTNFYNHKINIQTGSVIDIWQKLQ